MQKQTLGILCLICVLIMVFSLAKVIPLGMSGEVAAATPYFILMFTACVIGLPFAVKYQTYHSKQQEDVELERSRVQMKILAQTAPKPRPPQKTTPKSRQTGKK